MTFFINAHHIIHFIAKIHFRYSFSPKGRPYFLACCSISAPPKWAPRAIAPPLDPPSYATAFSAVLYWVLMFLENKEQCCYQVLNFEQYCSYKIKRHKTCLRFANKYGRPSGFSTLVSLIMLRRVGWQEPYFSSFSHLTKKRQCTAQYWYIDLIGN